MEPTGYAETEGLEKLMDESDTWIMFRYKDGEGIYLHWKNDDSASIIPIFMFHNPKFEELVFQNLKALKENIKK